MTHSSYVSMLVSPASVKQCGDLLVKKIEEEFPQVDYIAGIGISGTFLLSYVCANTGKFPFICRKESENSHADYTEEFSLCSTESPSAIILDDFVCGGSTARTVCERLSRHSITIKGILLYRDWGQVSKRDFGRGSISIFPLFSNHEEFGIFRDKYCTE